MKSRKQPNATALLIPRFTGFKPKPAYNKRKINARSVLFLSPELIGFDVLHLEALPVRPDEVLEEVVEHSGDAVHHGGVRKHGADLGAQPEDQFN